MAAARHGAILHLGAPADLQSILAVAPDAVVLATGSTPGWPDFLSTNLRDDGLVPDLREAVMLLRDYPGISPGRAVIWDADHGLFTYDAAEFLLERFEQVAILTSRERIASDESLIVRQGVYQRLYAKGVDILTSVKPLPDPRLEQGEIAYANIYGGAVGVLGGVAFLTYATPRIPQDALAAPLRERGIDVMRVGDCKAPRIVLTATAEGYRAGMDL